MESLSNLYGLIGHGDDFVNEILNWVLSDGSYNKGKVTITFEGTSRMYIYFKHVTTFEF